MDANNEHNPGEEAANDLERLPVQPRQPQNLQGLLRFAMEARQDTPEVDEPEIVPMNIERRNFLAEALQNMVMDAVAVLRAAIHVLTDVEKIGSLHNKDDITAEIKAVFENTLDVVDDLDVANDFCTMGGFDIFPLCYNTKNYKLWEYTNSLLAGVCQNFRPGQTMCLERGLLRKLVELLQEPDTQTKEKFISAISCSIRGYEAAEAELVSLGGCAVLAAQIGVEEPRLRTRATSLLRHLVEQYPDKVKDEIVNMNLPRILAPQLEKTVCLTTEPLLNLLKTSLVYSEVINQCRAPDLGLRKILQEIISSPAVLEERDQNREIIEYTNDILTSVFVSKDHVYDCEEEADR